MANKYEITIKSPKSGGGYDTKKFVPADYSIQYESLASSNSGRVASGTMRIDWKLRMIRKLVVKLPPHQFNHPTYSVLLSLVQGQVVKVSYYDYLTHQDISEEEMYCSKSNAGYSYRDLVEGVTIELIAMNGTNTVPHIDLTEYTITWKNYDNSVLATSTAITGETPTYPGQTPTRPATAQYTYTFSGWSPALGPISGDTTYTAQYSTITNQYTITATAGEHGSVSGGGTYAYGTSVTLTATPATGYVFDEWNDGNTSNPRIITVTGNASYSCTFEEAPPTPTEEYWVISFDKHYNDTTQEFYLHMGFQEEPDSEEPQPYDYDWYVEGALLFEFECYGVTYQRFSCTSPWYESNLYYEPTTSGIATNKVYDYADFWADPNYQVITTTTDPATIFVDGAVDGEAWSTFLSDNATVTHYINGVAQS